MFLSAGVINSNSSEEHSASEPANAHHIVSKVSSQVSAGGYASGRIGYVE